MNLARFAHNCADLRSVNLAGLKARVKGPTDVECRRTRPVPILDALSATGGWRQSRHPIMHANSKSPLAANPSTSYRCSCSSFQQGAFERGRRGVESHSQASTDSKYLA